MIKLKTPTIVALSLAVGLVGGASVTAIAQNQPNMRSALDNLVAAGQFRRLRAGAGHEGIPDRVHS